MILRTLCFLSILGAVLNFTGAQGVDIFTVLNIPRNSDATTIQSAYRRAALRLHPDKSTDPGATDKFKELSAAYTAWRGGGKRGPQGGRQSNPPTHPNPPERKRRGAGTYVVLATISGLATVTAQDLMVSANSAFGMSYH